MNIATGSTGAHPDASADGRPDASDRRGAENTPGPAPTGASEPAADSRINELRRRIDEIDASIIELWRERAEISRQVGATRVAAGGTRLVLAREREVLSRFRDALGADGTQVAMLILRAGRGRLG